MKVKSHRGDPLNEGAYLYYERKLGQWKKGKWTKTIRHTSRRGVTELLLEEHLQFGTNKWCKGIFEGRGENMEGV